MSYRILVADDDAPSREILGDALESEGFDVVLAQDGAEAWDLLQRDDAPQIAILDWSMPGMNGDEVCRRVREHDEYRYTYLLMLSALSDQEHIRGGLSAGADGYIAKPFHLGELVERVRAGCRFVDREVALREAQSELRAEHESHAAELAALAVTDELTGLHNRRGFVNLAEQHARVALRRRASFSIAFMDLDGLKAINDHLGHEFGDQALREAAHVLKTTLREADIIARLGGDEFVALLDCPPAQVDPVFERLRDALERLASTPGRRYRLAVSTGAAAFDPDNPTSVEDLLSVADQRMYALKRARRKDSRPVVIDMPPTDENRGPTLRPDSQLRSQSGSHFSCLRSSGGCSKSDSQGDSERTSSSMKPSIRSTASALNARSSFPLVSLLPAGKPGQLMHHLIAAWSVRRPDGFAHAYRIAAYAGLFAHALGYRTEEAERLSQVAALHDIGELAVPEHILLNRRKLSPEERARKRRHTSFARELLSAMPMLHGDLAANVAYHHHERWDGGGYPDGLRGEACPREARIVSLLDAYDNLRNPQSGEPGPDDDVLREHIERARGQAFDPALVDRFLEILSDLRILVPRSADGWTLSLAG